MSGLPSAVLFRAWATDPSIEREEDIPPDLLAKIQSEIATPTPQVPAGDELWPVTSAKTFGPPKPIAWGVPSFVPNGRLTLIEGQEGIGKGMFACMVAVDATRYGHSVLWITTEDDPQEDVQQRLLAAGYNPHKDADVWFVDDPHLVKIPQDTDKLERLIGKLNSAVVILDPGRDLIHREDGAPKNNNDETAIRPAMTALNKVAIRTGKAVLFIHHTNKGGGTMRQRSSGSGSFRQASRHVVTLARHRRGSAIGVDKSNIIDPRYKVRGYRTVGVVMGDLNSAKFEFLDDLQDQDLDSWLARLDWEDDQELQESRAGVCESCGDALTGRQTKYCSRACQMRHKRALDKEAGDAS